MSKANVLVSGGVALVVAVIVVLTGGGSVRDGSDGRDGRDGVSVGAVPVLQSPIEIEGTRKHVKRVALLNATSTVFSYKLPNATTTVSSFSCTLVSGISHIQPFQFATGAAMNATTTSLGDVTLTAGGRAIAVASTTNVVFAPNQFLVFKLGTTTGTVISTGYTPIGNCAVDVWEI